MLSEATSGLSFSAGCSRSSIVMVGAPPVVRLITTSHALFTLGRNCLNSAGSCVGLPSFGSRAWKCTIAAPAFAAPIAASAISSGVTGMYGDMLGVWIEPVTAQVMMTLPCAAAIAISYRRTSMEELILFDDLVGDRQQRWGNGETQSLRSAAVDQQFQFYGLLDRKIGRSRAFEDLVHVHRGAPEIFEQAGAIAHQAACLGVFANAGDRRQPIVCRQLGDLGGPLIKKSIAR